MFVFKKKKKATLQTKNIIQSHKVPFKKCYSIRPKTFILHSLQKYTTYKVYIQTKRILNSLFYDKYEIKRTTIKRYKKKSFDIPFIFYILSKIKKKGSCAKYIILLPSTYYLNDCLVGIFFGNFAHHVLK